MKLTVLHTTEPKVGAGIVREVSNGADIPNRETDQIQPHPVQIRRGRRFHHGCARGRISSNFIGARIPQDAVEMFIENRPNDPFHFSLALIQEVFGWRDNGNVGAADSNLSEAIRLHSTSTGSLDPHMRQVNIDNLQRQGVRLLYHGENECAAAFDDSEADDMTVRQVSAGNNQGLVRANLSIATQKYEPEHKHHQDDGTCCED